MTHVPDLHPPAVLPLILVGVAALGVLLGEIGLRGRTEVLGRRVTPEFRGTALAMGSAFFLLLAVVVAVQSFLVGDAVSFNPDRPLVLADRLANFGIAVVALGALLSCLLAIHYLGVLRINHGEYYALLLLATAGMILLVGAVDLVAVFLGIEIMSIPIYVLAGFDRRRRRSNESALKYFLVGSFASALLLYGMALLYGATGSTQFDAIRAAFDPESPLAAVGLGLVLVGFSFKISSVPFHQWTPDVYEGAPVAVTAFMSVTVKTAAFVALLRIVSEAFAPAAATLEPIFQVLAGATMLVGNVMAVIQSNLKRLLAYSAVAHAGYLLLGFVAASEAGYAAVLFYLLVYLFMNLGAFAVVTTLAQRGQEVERIDDLAGLARSRPGLAAALTLFAVSLAGLPGTGGFIAKVQLFAAAVAAGHVGLAVLGVLTSVVGVYYYLRLPVVMYMREPASDRADSPAGAPLAGAEWFVLVVCAVAVLVLGVLPNGGGDGALAWLPPALEWSRSAVAEVAVAAP